MSYTPTRGDAAELALTGDYVPPFGATVALEFAPPCYARPAGNGVGLSLGGDYTPPAGDAISLDLVCDQVPCYEAPEGNAVGLVLRGPYTPPAGDEIGLPLVCAGFTPAPEPEPEPEPDPGYIFGGLTTSARIAWAPRPKSSLRALTTAIWRQSGQRDAAPRVAWGDAAPGQVHARSSWAKVPQRDARSRMAWVALGDISLRHAPRVAWQFTPPKDGRARVAWGTAPTPIAACAGIAHSNPPAEDWQARVSWGTDAEPLRAEIGAVWLDSVAKDSLDYRVPWGHLYGTRYVFLGLSQPHRLSRRSPHPATNRRKATRCRSPCRGYMLSLIHI